MIESLNTEAVQALRNARIADQYSVGICAALYWLDRGKVDTAIEALKTAQENARNLSKRSAADVVEQFL